MKALDRRGFLTGFATLVLFTGLASDALRNSLGWYGFGAIVLALTALSIAVLVHHRRTIRFTALPWPLVAFLALATLSIAWSHYPATSVLAVFVQLITTIYALAVAFVLTADELLLVLGRVLRIILSLSLVFELVVALIIRAPVLPVWVTGEDRVDPPKLLYWSRNLLLEGDQIQGIVGSSSLLAMVALLALIVFDVQLASGTVRRVPGILWLMLAVATVALTRSATIYIGIVAVAVVLGMILLMRRASTPRARLVTSVGIVAGLAAVLAAGLLLRGQILNAFGKSDDLTGRLEIWEAVIGLAQQRPIVGWGWISFWAPWVEPYNDLIIRNGVAQLHAHNAWLDVWMQLGVLGIIVFGALVVTTAIRSWLLATDRVITAPHDPGHFSWLALLPPLLLTALLVQTLAESRILVEGGWILLVILAVTTKLGMLGRMTRSSVR